MKSLDLSELVFAVGDLYNKSKSLDGLHNRRGEIYRRVGNRFTTEFGDFIIGVGPRWTVDLFRENEVPEYLSAPFTTTTVVIVPADDVAVTSLKQIDRPRISMADADDIVVGKTKLFTRYTFCEQDSWTSVTRSEAAYRKEIKQMMASIKDQMESDITATDRYIAEERIEELQSPEDAV